MLRDPARLSRIAHRSARGAVAAAILAVAITSDGYAAGPEGMLAPSPERPWIVPNTATYSSFAAERSTGEQASGAPAIHPAQGLRARRADRYRPENQSRDPRRLGARAGGGARRGDRGKRVRAHAFRQGHRGLPAVLVTASQDRPDPRGLLCCRHAVLPARTHVEVAALRLRGQAGNRRSDPRASGRYEFRLQRDAPEDRLRCHAGLLCPERRGGTGRGRACRARAGANAAGRCRGAPGPRSRYAPGSTAGPGADGPIGLRAAGGTRRRDRRAHGAPRSDGRAPDDAAAHREPRWPQATRRTREHRRKAGRDRARATPGPAGARGGGARARGRGPQGPVGVLSPDRSRRRPRPEHRPPAHPGHPRLVGRERDRPTAPRSRSSCRSSTAACDATVWAWPKRSAASPTSSSTLPATRPCARSSRPTRTSRSP